MDVTMGRHKQILKRIRKAHGTEVVFKAVSLLRI